MYACRYLSPAPSFCALAITPKQMLPDTYCSKTNDKDQTSTSQQPDLGVPSPMIDSHSLTVCVSLGVTDFWIVDQARRGGPARVLLPRRP